jgi:hypothetical protein
VCDVARWWPGGVGPVKRGAALAFVTATPTKTC